MPVSIRIDFKILLVVFKALHGLARAYLSDMLPAYEPQRSLKSFSCCSELVVRQPLGFRRCLIVCVFLFYNFYYKIISDVALVPCSLTHSNGSDQTSVLVRGERGARGYEVAVCHSHIGWLSLIVRHKYTPVSTRSLYTVLTATGERWRYWWLWQQFEHRTPVRDFMRWGDKVCLQMNCRLCLMLRWDCQNRAFHSSTCSSLPEAPCCHKPEGSVSLNSEWMNWINTH